jgi:hypothetical protein
MRILVQSLRGRRCSEDSEFSVLVAWCIVERACIDAEKVDPLQRNELKSTHLLLPSFRALHFAPLSV